MTSPDHDESAEFTEQTRWLIEQHNARSEAFTTRAVALLGFEGVILALLLQGAGMDGMKASAWTWIWLALTVAPLFISACLCLWAIIPARTHMPSADQLRLWWKTHAAAPRAGFASPQIAESLLNSSDLTKPSPLSDARDDADLRGSRFKWALRLMLTSLLFLTLLLLNVLLHTWRR